MRKSSREEFYKINGHFIDMIKPSGIKIIKIYLCPHPEEANCACRKPQPGMLLQAAKDYGIDMSCSWMIGDRQSDITAGINVGTRTILVATGNNLVVSADATYTADNILDAVGFITSS